MKKNRGVSAKILILLLALVLLLGCAVGGTLSWLMTRTEPVVNTFTVGKVSIKLQEHVLDINTGQWQDPEFLTDAGNLNIQSLPGRKILKDPTLTVEKGSEECYTRILMKVMWGPDADNEFAEFAYYDWFQFNPNWQIKRIFDGSHATNDKYVGFDIYELRYIPGTVDATTSDQVIPVIYNMTIPDYLEKDEIDALEGAGLILVAQAVQAEGFASADAAFAAAGYPAGWDPDTIQP